MSLEPTPDPEETTGPEYAAEPAEGTVPPQASEHQQTAAALASPRRRDWLPPWVVALLVLFTVARLYEVLVPVRLAGPISKMASQKSGDGGLDVDAMQDLLSTDLTTKLGFIQGIIDPSGDAEPGREEIDKALESAENLQRESGSTPSTARRVLILRALLRQHKDQENDRQGAPAGDKKKPGAKKTPASKTTPAPPPDAKTTAAPSLDAGTNAARDAKSNPVANTKLGVKSNPDAKTKPDANAPAKATPPSIDPLAAFAAPPADGLSEADKARYAEEGRLWREVLGSEKLSLARMADLDLRIRAIPNIRWWRYPALALLHRSHGDLEGAQKYSRQAGYECVLSVFGVLAVGLMRVGLVLIGVVVLGYFLVLYLRNRAAAQAGEPLVRNLWKTEPPPIPDSQRRLGAGDLMGVFVVYLLTQEVIRLLLSGFPGIGGAHTFRFDGLLTPHIDRIGKLPPGTRNLISVGLESAVYLINAIPPLLVLLNIARRRGASLADEIGWNHRKALSNFFYALGGFAVAQPIMIAVSLAAPRLFQHMPDPSNPAIPQLVNSSSAIATGMLVALASLAAPVVEEFLFRGVLYQAVRLRTGAWPAIIITGLVFGFVHPVGIEQMFALAVLGGAFAWLAETRKSLFPGMVAHGFNNLTTTLLLLWAMAG